MDFNSYLAYARSLAGIGQFPQSLKTIDDCLEEWKKAPHLITRDFLVMAFLTKASVLDALGHTDEAIETLNGVNKIYPKDKTVCLALAEKYHRKGQYDKIYENLVNIRNDKYPVGFFPTNTLLLEREEKQLLLLSSLAVGDFNVAEECLRKQTGDNNFTIRRPGKTAIDF
jgi:tetratricopeptide (TPR) repeat protein